jgi:glutathione synthase/RimK-type ligase-like ATP-grasp enzyme
MRRLEVAIVSIGDDLHGLIIRKALEKYRDLRCRIIQSDRLCASAALSWSNDSKSNFECKLPVRGKGQSLKVTDLDVIWWRRVGFPQQIPSDVTDPIHRDVIENDCRAALLGVLLDQFSGTWINHPVNTSLAENKLVQLRAAQQSGFQVPRTLVSQDPVSIRQFCRALDYKVVVKAVRGTRKARMFTNMVTPAHLASDASLALCPATYQEYIPGESHIRVHCFGQTVHSVIIKSRALDWRTNLDVPFTPTDLDDNTKARVLSVLKLLGLKMGVVDLKVTPDGEPVWFEVNPQGQFLFVEGLCGLQLAAAFADFLHTEARDTKHSALPATAIEMAPVTKH